MMKKFGFFLGGLLALIVVLYLTGRFTGALRLHSMPGNSSEPSIKLGQKFWVSNLKKPKRGDLICFSHEDSMYGKHKRIFRLCGMEGDTLQMRDAVLYVNGTNFDRELNLKNDYKVTGKDVGQINFGEFGITDNDFHFVNDSTLLVSLSSKAENVLKQHFSISKSIIESDSRSSLWSKFQKSWSIDNFGPIVIQKGQFFVLGDNRHGAEDSRFTGPIPEEKVDGVALLK